MHLEAAESDLEQLLIELVCRVHAAMQTPEGPEGAGAQDGAETPIIFRQGKVCMYSTLHM